MSEYFRRIDAMLAQHQMPPEYANTQSHVYCNDCEKKCYSKFHFLYHKCSHCNGYNTKVLKTVEILPEDARKLLGSSDEGLASAAIGAVPGGGVSPVNGNFDSNASSSTSS